MELGHSNEPSTSVSVSGRLIKSWRENQSLAEGLYTFEYSEKQKANTRLLSYAVQNVAAISVIR